MDGHDRHGCPEGHKGTPSCLCFSIKFGGVILEFRGNLLLLFGVDLVSINELLLVIVGTVGLVAASTVNLFVLGGPAI